MCCTMIIVMFGAQRKHFFPDIEYWRTPSRKLYVARFSEYQDLAKRRKRLGLSLGKRRNEDSSDQEEKVSKLEETVDVVSN